MTGSTGMLGGVMASKWRDRYDLSCLGGRNEFDFLHCDYDLLKKRFDPEVVVHTSAITNMDYCESHPSETMIVNGESVKELVSVFPNAKIIFISSDAVLPPNTKLATEKIKTNPQSIYGKAKELGEKYVMECKHATAIRTTIVGKNITKTGHSLCEWIVESLRRMETITLFDDVWFSPIDVWNFAEAVEWVMKNDTPRILHIGGGERVTKYQFGVGIATALNLPTKLIKKGKLMKEMSLDSSMYTKLSGAKLPDLTEVVRMIAKYYK